MAAHGIEQFKDHLLLSHSGALNIFNEALQQTHRAPQAGLTIICGLTISWFDNHWNISLSLGLVYDSRYVYACNMCMLLRVQSEELGSETFSLYNSHALVCQVLLR